ncbi:MAG: Gfo/Idh/MocA family oxidoreductase [Betaproteobacteria bacterium]
MSERKIGIIVNGATGRMTRNQHLANALVAIRDNGGLKLADGMQLVPDLLLVGRDAERLRQLAAGFGIPDAWSTDLDAALASDRYGIYFDGVTTALRPDNLRRAISAGKHVYCEKPIALTAAEADDIAALATQKGIKHGVVHDKLWAPGMRKLGMLARSGFFGRILTVRIEGCYWVFEGDLQPIQRPSWNYRANEGGSMILDMMPHYRYMIESIVAPIRRMVCHGVTHVSQRWDENGKPYVADADDACYAILELEGGVVAQIMSSWCVRVRRDDIITMQIDGTAGSAVAGLSHCWIQPHMATPKAQWALDAGKPVDFRADWQLVPETEPYVNAFRAQWELFLLHVAEGTPFPWTLDSGARGVALAEKATASSREGKWVDV